MIIYEKKTIPELKTQNCKTLHVLQVNFFL